eukprot:scaffold26140_cov79-Isochrysis_galbana.AAC.1
MVARRVGSGSRSPSSSPVRRYASDAGRRGTRARGAARRPRRASAEVGTAPAAASRAPVPQADRAPRAEPPTVAGSRRTPTVPPSGGSPGPRPLPQTAAAARPSAPLRWRAPGARRVQGSGEPPPARRREPPRACAAPTRPVAGGSGRATEGSRRRGRRAAPGACRCWLACSLTSRSRRGGAGFSAPNRATAPAPQTRPLGRQAGERQHGSPSRRPYPPRWTPT